MRDKEIQEGLADLAPKAEMDHEVQMAMVPFIQDCPRSKTA